MKKNQSLASLFTRPESTIERLSGKIKDAGFRQDKPILVTEDNTILDGYTRVEAATRAGLKEVPIVVKDGLVKMQDMLEFALAEQRDRRNLSDADILQCVKAFDGNDWSGLRKADKENGEHEYAPIAEKIGCSVYKVQLAKEILKNDRANVDEYVKRLVESIESDGSCKRRSSERYTLRKALAEAKENTEKTNSKGKNAVQANSSSQQSVLVSLARDLIDRAMSYAVLKTTDPVQPKEIGKKLSSVPDAILRRTKPVLSKKATDQEKQIAETFDWFVLGLPR